MTPTFICPEATIVMPKIEDLFGKVVWAKRICIDLDGVICEYDFPKIVKSFFGVDISGLILSAYDLADLLGVSSRMIDLMFREQVWGKPAFIEGSIQTLKEWESKGYELLIFSNRVKYMGQEGLMDWLMDYHIPFSSIDDGKGEYDVHIDDRPSKLRDTDSKLKLLFDQPWNKNCFNIEGVLERVHNWEEIRKKVSLQ